MANVFFLADNLTLGGVTSYIKTLCTALAQRGHKVSVVINKTEGYSGEPWIEGVTVHIMPVGALDTRAAVTSRLRKLLHKHSAEWVFFNNCYYVDSYAMKDTKMQGVYVVHSNLDEELGRFIKEGLYCQYIVGPTPAVSERFQRALPAYYSQHIAHGTHVPSQHVPKPDPFHIVYLGRLSPEKGVDLLAPIVAPLLNKYPDIQFTMLGDGKGWEEYAELAREAVRNAVENGTQLHIRPGTSSREELDDLLTSAHVLVVPSRQESFGLVAIEGAAWGAVPVVSRIAGVTDRIFENGTEAFLCSPDDPQAFREAIDTLYHNRLLREKMAKAAYQKVKSCFSVEAMAAAYENLMMAPARHKVIKRNATQHAFAAYRHLLFLEVRKSLG